MKQALGSTEDRTTNLGWGDINEGFIEEVKKEVGLGAPWGFVRLRSGGEHSRARLLCVSLENVRHLGGVWVLWGGRS